MRACFVARSVLLWVLLPLVSEAHNIRTLLMLKGRYRRFSSNAGWIESSVWNIMLSGIHSALNPVKFVPPYLFYLWTTHFQGTHTGRPVNKCLTFAFLPLQQSCLHLQKMPTSLAPSGLHGRELDGCQRSMQEFMWKWIGDVTKVKSRWDDARQRTE